MDHSTAARAAAVEELSRVLAATSAQFDHAVAADLDGLTPTQWHVLSALEGGVGEPMSALAAITLLPGPSLTRLIDGMIDDNLVLRKVDETDRRRVLVFVTRRGAALCSRIRAKVGRSQGVADLIADPDGPAARLVALIAELSPADSMR
ncbi:MarR family winged helix-turn-helix transcriptional regulator [Gordonia sp. NPDC003425]